MRTLPSRPNWEHLQTQAKDLLARARSNDADAIALLSTVHPVGPAKLADAQRAVARDYGFASWYKLKQAVLSARVDDPDAFVRAAVLESVSATLALMPSKHSLASACITGSVDLDQIAEVNAPLPPIGMTPLLYASFSCLMQTERFQPALARLIRSLLDRGADPNATWTDPRWPTSPLRPLYGALGRNNCIPIARMLLEAGSIPDDGECLYHAAEHRDLAGVRLLIEFGVKPEQTNALKRMLDYEDPVGLRLLLELGTDPDEYPDPALHHAIIRGRSPEILGILLDAGAQIDRKDTHGLSAYDLALQMGQNASADYLVSRGASQELSPISRYLGGDETAVMDLAEAAIVMIELASHGDTRRVVRLLDAGVPVNSRRPTGNRETALHQAAWSAHVDTVRALLERGADPNLQDATYGGTPAGWASHNPTTDPARRDRVIAMLGG